MANPLTMKAVFESLLPDGAIWNPKIDGDFDKLLTGLGLCADQVYAELQAAAFYKDPQLTALLKDLEKEYGVLTDLRLTESDRRNQLAVIKYAQRGSGNADYLQDQLQLAGFNVNVISNDPAIDPALIVQIDYLCFAGGFNAYAGEPSAVIGSAGAELLVNGGMYTLTPLYMIQAGGDLSYAGQTEALAGYFESLLYNLFLYQLINDVNRWRYVFFIGGQHYGWPLDSDLLELANNSKELIVYHDYYTQYSKDYTRYRNQRVDTGLTFSSEGVEFPDIDSSIEITFRDEFDLNESTFVIYADFQTTSTEAMIWRDNDYRFLIDGTQIRLVDSIPTIHKITHDVTGDKYVAVNWKIGEVAECFVDGASIGNLDSGNIVLNYASDQPIFIGNESGGGSRFRSKMRAMLIFNRKLTAEEHAQLYLDLQNLELPWIDEVQIPNEKKEVFKRLVLKHKPLHSWAGLVINWV